MPELGKNVGGGRFILFLLISLAKGYFCTPFSFLFRFNHDKGKAIRKENMEKQKIKIRSGDADGPPVNLDRYR